MLAGGVAIAVGCFLPWASFGGVTINGFDEVLFYESDTGTGVAFMLFAVVMAAFGITTLAARRSLPIMIIGIVIAAFSVLGAVAEYSEYNDMFVDNDRIGGHLGGGLPVVGIGSAVALGGAIAGCSKRRRWPAT